MDSINFLIENDPNELVKNPIVQEYLKEEKTTIWFKLVEKLSNIQPLLKELKTKNN